MKYQRHDHITHLDHDEPGETSASSSAISCLSAKVWNDRRMVGLDVVVLHMLHFRETPHRQDLLTCIACLAYGLALLP